MSYKLGLGVPVPQMLPVTGTWSLPFAAYLIFLSNRVVYHRLTNRKFFGQNTSKMPEDPSDPLYVACRSQANFIEYVPMGLMLAAFAEINGADRKTLNWALATFFALRVAHVELGLQIKEAKGEGRIAGYYGTQAYLAAMGGWCAWLCRGYWGY